MNTEYIVRADFYPDGKIIPLGITNSQGKTSYIQHIITSLRVYPNEYRIKCVSDGKVISLIFKNGYWEVNTII